MAGASIGTSSHVSSTVRLLPFFLVGRMQYDAKASPRFVHLSFPFLGRLPIAADVEGHLI